MSTSLLIALLRNVYDVTFSERIAHFLGQQPDVHPTAFIAPSAIIVGAVTIGEGSSVWFGATVRGDINAVTAVLDMYFSNCNTQHTKVRIED